MVEKVDIKNRSGNMSAAPTPQNTPSSANNTTFGAKEPQFKTIDEGDEDLEAIDGRLDSLRNLTSHRISELPTSVQKRISSLKGLQKQYSSLELQFQRELFELEKTFAKKYGPLFERRRELVHGEKEPSEEEIKKGIPEGEELSKVLEGKNQKDQEMKGIPEFWLTAMKNVLSLSEMITPEDEKALRHLIDVRLVYMEKPGFQLQFEFEENPFFSNKVLTKSYYYLEETGASNVFMYGSAKGDEVHWHPNADLTIRTVVKKQRNKNTKQTRTVKVSESRDSFFNFFSPPQMEDEEEENPGLDELLELDYQIGEDFKEKLIPRAVDWFTGEALEDYDEFGDLDVEDDDEDAESSSNENFSDSDDDSSENEDEDRTAHSKQNPAECRQQ
ncbi:nucleosome assembly protein Nap1 [Schizosaccharomyces octosporus yFS286]|uniref:Nucleosome assembly protein Nap1 n=1 Tax=Schizosaccharomyces octosporus (strain yFS286) TaxID=483514 RepID=S9PV61_SCHOY|nr:nucleosome assembly protein Nap1 [Schizosaccharomyces octosporus yFS286]EPX71877.1 nucleosome assembly protein Nap1 [Schizosaccharomyces octosporus yFS286]